MVKMNLKKYESSPCRWVWDAEAQGGWGGTPIFSYIFGGFIILDFNFFIFFFFGGGGGGFRKNCNFGGMNIFWGVSAKLDYLLGVISMHFRVFFRSRYKMGIFFLSCLNF